MPIPHLSHKIHSPNNWQGRPVKKSHLKKRGRLLKFGKKMPSFSDIKFNIKNKKSRGPVFKKLLPYAAGLFLVLIIIFVGMVAWFSKDLPDPNKLSDRTIAQSTKIYDRTGEHLLYEIHGEQKRTIISLSDVPEYAIQATLALEDQQFYEHKGFNLWGIFRGVVIRTLTGHRPQGGSTLTQQLVKNAILGDERSITRKLKELVLAYRIEQKYSKEEILQMYFNEIPYGSTAYGIEAASNYYFGKSAKDLTLGEAAILAALPQAPSYYSPWGSHTDALFGRQQYALSQMAELGYITQEQADEAKQEEIKFTNRIEGITAPHFVFFVKSLLAETYGDQLIEQGGFKIISTLDWDLQKKAEEIVAAQAEKNNERYEASNASLVAIDVNTGQILAMVGSKDFFDEEIDGQFNVATSPRQPGSSFKPIVYTAGFIRGYVPETILYDLETTFITETGETYEPHNYDLEEHGPVTIRKALAGSLNIPAVKMIYLAGISNVLDLADDLGYTTLKDRSRFGLSLVLGGGEVTLLEHTNAFAALAREGKRLPYAAVLEMEDQTGKTMEEFNQPRATKIIDPEIARITTDILSDNNARAYVFGESNYLTLPDRPVAAKTGTTNDYRDAWTLGYTPDIAVGVWVGNNDFSISMKRGAAGGVVAAPIWQQFMKVATQNQPAKEFTKPSYQIPNKPMLGGNSSGITVTIDKLTGLLATDDTPENLQEEKTFKQAHSILHYVDKDNPLGEIPENPAQDSYYSYWEEPVIKWAIENNITNESPPTEYDNIHHAEDQPQVNWLSPNNGQKLTEQSVELEITASAKRGIKKVEYYLDQILIGQTSQAPFKLQVNLPVTVINGEHQLIAKAYDDLKNTGISSITVNLERPSYLNINWIQPIPGSALNLTDFPYTLIINVDDPTKIKKVDFYLKQGGGQSSNWLNYTEAPNQNNIRVLWGDPPATGNYKLYPVITSWQEQLINGPEINISLE